MKRLSGFSDLSALSALGGLAQRGPSGGGGADVYSLSFDGVDDTVTCANGGNLATGNFTTVVTLAAWIKPATFGNWQQPVANGDGNSTTGYGFECLTSGKVEWYAGAWSVYAEGSAPANTWTHVAGTYDHTTGDIKLYVNGVLADTRTVAGGTNQVGAPGTVVMGAGLLGTFWQGKLDDVAVWSLVLGTTDIAALAAKTKRPSDLATGLLAYWPFEEGSGTSTADGTGNGNTGTLNNGTAWSTDVP